MNVVEEIAHWQGLLEAMDQREGTAAVTYAGDMVDVAHEETAFIPPPFTGEG